MSRVRRVARGAVLAVAAIGAALASGPGAVGEQPERRQIDVDVTYQCPRPTDRTWQLELHVTGTFPTRGAVDEPVRPEDVSLTVSVPPEALAQLPGAVAATAAVKLDTSIVQGSSAASATWGATQDVPVPLVADGPTVFTGTSSPEPVTAGEAGDLSFSAGGMAVTLTGWNADGAVTEPPTADLTCLPDTEATLAVVPVGAVDTPTTSTNEQPDLEVGRGGDTGAAPLAAAAGAPPPECHKIEAPPGVTNYQSYCANMAGYANVAKLNASTLQPAGLINISAGSFVARCDGVAGKFCSKNTVLPNYQGEPKLPPAPGSFFTFGFIPTTGTMQLTQLGIGNVDIWFQGTAGLATARLRVSARLFDTAVNGVPLDVGPNCHTATPIDVVLTATPATYSITNGGVLAGVIDIPPFTDCGVTEDLSPIITGLVSGPNNYVKMTQSKVCSLSNGVNCPPEVPIPKR
jgi:hypothetical protein